MALKRQGKRILVGESLGEIDKVFATMSPAQMMVACNHHVWMLLKEGVEIRNARTAELVHAWETTLSKGNSTGSIWSILAVPTRSKGQHVWMGLSNGSVEVYDAQSFVMVRQLATHAGGVYCLAEFGGYVYSGSSDFKIAQWDAEDGRLVRVLHGHSNYVRCLYAEGSAVVSGSDDSTVRVWDAGSGEAQLTGHFHSGAGVSALCRVGVTMWSGDNEGRVIAWKLSSCEALRVLQAHGGRVASLRKIGSRVYSGGADGVIAVFDAEDGRLLQRIEDHRGARITALLGPSELRRFRIWSCGTDNAVRCWYQDEYVTLTDDQERFAESFWYHAGSSPYRDFRESVMRQNGLLRNKLMLEERQNKLMLDLLHFSESTLSPTHMQQREDKTKKEYLLAKDRQATAECELKRARERLQHLEKDLGTILELLRVAQAELKVLDLPAFNANQKYISDMGFGAGVENMVQMLPSQVAAVSVSNRLGPSVAGVTTHPPGGIGVGGVTAQPPGGIGVGGVTTHPPGGIGVGGVTAHPPGGIGVGGVTTQPPGGIGVGGVTTHPPGGIGVGGVTTQPPGGIGVGGVTAHPPGGIGVGGVTAQPPGGIGVGGVTAHPPGGIGVGGVTTHPPGGIGVGGVTAQPPGGIGVGGVTAQPLGGIGVGGVTAQPPGGIGVGGVTAQPLGGIGVGGVTAQPPGGIGVGGVTAQPPGGIGVGGVTAHPPGGIGVGGVTAHPPGGIGVGGVTTQPPGGIGVGGVTVQTSTIGGVGSTIGKTLECQPIAHHDATLQHDGASLEALARSAAVEGGRSWRGVKWTNKNVGCYIQRRFYGAEPSLRAPDLEKRRLRQKRLPSVRVVPFKVKKDTE